ncbi:MAG: CoA transferase [Rhodobacteraceae bacterium]|nr:CoA transferase [Paracoccaceae bacterium]PHR53915.1 MAG: CoA transferase [Robiginitomaculum sp.]
MAKTTDTARKGPLAGIKVLDFSRILSGPYASMTLSDLGAEIIKIEPIESGDETRNFPPFQGGLSHYYIALNRNKKSISLDLKSSDGVNIAKRLAAQCDIVLENFRPGVMDRLGLGYDVLKETNPALIYCSITGFGKNSPHSDKPAFDIVAQALSGIMSVNCEPGHPPNKLSIPLGDMAGSIFSVFGMLAALHEKNLTGIGRHVEVAMLDSLISMQGYLSQLYFVTGQTPQPVGTRHPSIVPYGSYPTKDGHVIVACLTERFWHNFARSLDMDSLISDQRFALYEDRLANCAELEPILQARITQNTTAYWLEQLTKFDVPNAPILSIGEALEQEHVAAHGLVETVTHPKAGDIRIVKGPILFDGQGPSPAIAPSFLGEDSKEILAKILGMSSSEIDGLVDNNIVGSQ